MKQVYLVIAVLFETKSYNYASYSCSATSPSIASTMDRVLSTCRTKTHTIETDDDGFDSIDAGKQGSATEKTKTTTTTSVASSPYAIPKTSTTTTTSETTGASSVAKHKKESNSTISDDAILSNDDDGMDPNMTTYTDMLDIMKNNNANSHDTNDTVVIAGGKVVLPPEREPTETWTIAIASLFTSMAITLCIVTGYRYYCKNKSRDGYQEIGNIVV